MKKQPTIKISKFFNWEELFSLFYDNVLWGLTPLFVLYLINVSFGFQIDILTEFSKIAVVLSIVLCNISMKNNSHVDNTNITYKWISNIIRALFAATIILFVVIVTADFIIACNNVSGNIVQTSNLETLKYSILIIFFTLIFLTHLSSRVANFTFDEEMGVDSQQMAEKANENQEIDGMRI